jgi:hypothetical protein
MKNKKLLKKIFTKEELLKFKKYNRLLGYNIPYDLINRSYQRYLKNIDGYIALNHYPKYWFGKNRDIFCNAVKFYIEAKLMDFTPQFGTRGFVNLEIVKVSKIEQWL